MKKIEFFVEGMTCASCVAKVESKLQQMEEIEEVKVSLFDNKVKIKAKENLEKEKVYQVVQALGYRPFENVKQSLSTPTTRPLMRTKKLLSKQKIQQALEKSSLVKETKPKKKTSLPSKSKEKLILNKNLESLEMPLTLLLGSLLFYLGMAHMFALPMPAFLLHKEGLFLFALLQTALALALMLLQRKMLLSGCKALYYRSPNMYSLVAIGVLSAFVYSSFLLFPFAEAHFLQDETKMHSLMKHLYFESAGTILALMRLGKYLEEKGKNRAKTSLQSLLSLRTQSVKVEQAQGFVLKNFEEIQAGDVLLMETGNRISVDGEILYGEGSVDTSSFTGESLPRFAEKGDEMKAGTLVLSGFFKVKATKVGEESSLSRMIARVLEASESKTEIARLADKISLVFVPSVLVLALLALCYWSFAENFAFALKTAIMVLIISCPCALGLASPLAMMVGTGRAAKEGILFKNAQKMEESQKIDVLVLDKTGTLTEGKMELAYLLDFSTEEVLQEQETQKAYLHLASHLEQGSLHPLAKAIWKSYQEHLGTETLVFTETLENFEEKAGLGVSARLQGKHYALGNKKHMLQILEKNAVAKDKLQKIEEKITLISSKHSKEILLYLAEEQEIKAVFAFRDPLKADAKASLVSLQKKGIKLVLASGDRKEQVEEVAKFLGIEENFAECTPENKFSLIEKYQAEGKRVAMVGDGINDAAALAKADLSIVMGEGAEISLETADIILLKNRLQDIDKALQMSQAVLKNIKQNLFWAFFYNLLFIPVALGVFYVPFGLQLEAVMAAVAMSLSDLFIIGNALSLNRKKFLS